MTIAQLKENLVLPVISSPMFLVSGTSLVIEACKSGIIGTFPSLNGRTAADFEEMVKTIISEISKWEEESGVKAAPFGVNIIVNKTNPRVMEDLAICKKYNVPLIITSLGAVKEVVDFVHSYGGLVFHDIIKKRHAEKAVEAGVDGLIAVCAGAGGHAGTASPFAFMTELRSFFSGPIVLAGSISNGRDILAAQVIDAEFAYMGTRFIGTVESLANDSHKEMLLSSTIADIVYTDRISGVNANFMKKSIENAGLDLSTEVEEDFSDLHNDKKSKAWKDVWSAGHGTTSIHTIPTVSQLVEKLKEEYTAAKRKF